MLKCLISFYFIYTPLYVSICRDNHQMVLRLHSSHSTVTKNALILNTVQTQVVCSVLVFRYNSMFISSLHLCYIPSPSYSSFLGLSIIIWEEYRSWSLMLRGFLEPPITSSLLDPVCSQTQSVHIFPILSVSYETKFWMACFQDARRPWWNPRLRIHCPGNYSVAIRLASNEASVVASLIYYRSISLEKSEVTAKCFR
jgi:hypothetical protein